MQRLSRAAPEEIAVALVLVVVLALAALRPGSIGRLFESPYATPAPSGGPALEFLRPSPTPSPASAGEMRLLGEIQRIRVQWNSAGRATCGDVAWTQPAAGAPITVVCLPASSAAATAP